MIIADDLSPDYFGFYEEHGDTIDTPNLRRLLAKGVRFTNAMSNPVCSATRSTLLTGRYSFRTGVGDVVDGSNPKLNINENIFPKVLNIYSPNGIRIPSY